MGDEGVGSMVRATFFGFISSSCSFAALATARALFAKGAAFAPTLAFLLASTNLVIELGIVISVFLSWHFVVAEYLGGLFLIAAVWAMLALWRPKRLIDRTREALEAGEDEEPADPSELLRSRALWASLGRRYWGEWHMVWKDVMVGFTIAGIIAAFVPPAFFAYLFPGTDSGEALSLGQVVLHALIGPVAAFFTFIGSMGNIPLAGLLYANGVSMAGVMAFIFSDLVVLPVIRVHAQYYGWRMALYIAGLFLAGLVVTALVVHYAFGLTGYEPQAGDKGLLAPKERFAIDYTFWLNMLFGAVSGGFALLAMMKGPGKEHGHRHSHGGAIDRILFGLALASLVWLLIGIWLSVLS
jgi:uncharacterized membrane protein YraQ (UPF0718 family)